MCLPYPCPLTYLPCVITPTCPASPSSPISDVLRSVAHEFIHSVRRVAHAAGSDDALEGYLESVHAVIMSAVGEIDELPFEQLPVRHVITDEHLAVLKVPLEVEDTRYLVLAVVLHRHHLGQHVLSAAPDEVLERDGLTHDGVRVAPTRPAHRREVHHLLDMTVPNLPSEAIDEIEQAADTIVSHRPSPGIVRVGLGLGPRADHRLLSDGEVPSLHDQQPLRDVFWTYVLKPVALEEGTEHGIDITLHTRHEHGTTEGPERQVHVVYGEALVKVLLPQQPHIGASLEREVLRERHPVPLHDAGVYLHEYRDARSEEHTS